MHLTQPITTILCLVLCSLVSMLLIGDVIGNFNAIVIGAISGAIYMTATPSLFEHWLKPLAQKNVEE